MRPIFQRPLYQYSGGCIDLSPACVEFVLFCLSSSGGGLAPDPRRMGADRGRLEGLPAQQYLSSPLREIRGPRRGDDGRRNRRPRVWQPAPPQPPVVPRRITGVIVGRTRGAGDQPGVVGGGSCQPPPSEPLRPRFQASGLLEPCRGVGTSKLRSRRPTP